MPQINDIQISKRNDLSSAYIKVADSSSVLAGDEYNRFESTKSGNFIKGATIFTDHPENIKIGGVFKINGLHTSTMASTIVTPMPLLTFDYPADKIMNNIQELATSILEII